MTEPVSPIRRERKTLSGKTPPQNLEMEQSTLGAILLDTEAFPKVLEVFTESDVFYHPSHRHIFSSMVELYEKGEPIDLMTVSENLKRQGAFDSIGYEYLADLIDSTPTAANVKAHAKIVYEKALLRKLITVAGEVVTLAYEGGEDVETLIDQVEKMIFNVSNDRIGKSLEQIKKILKVSVKTIEKQFENKQLVTGAPTGFKDLDGKTAGLHPSDLIIVAGRPSMGKTAFAMNIAQNLTIGNDENVVAIFSLEMSAEQLVLRMLCSEARVSGHKIRTGYLSHSDWPKLTTAAGRLHNCKMYIDDSPGATVLDIRAKARRLQAEKGRLDLVIVDYLQLMSSRGKVESRVLEVSEITRSLKQLAKELSVPVIAISQLSRKVEDRPDKRPQLADLRESGSIEQDADLVLFVYREEFYKRDEPQLQGLADIIIGKQRNGPVGKVPLTFLKDYTRFEDFAGGEPEGGYDDGM